jgi:hypothetical protein
VDIHSSCAACRRSVKLQAPSLTFILARCHCLGDQALQRGTCKVSGLHQTLGEMREAFGVAAQQIECPLLGGLKTFAQGGVQGGARVQMLGRL